jgi:ABC-2 type transport system permease protein
MRNTWLVIRREYLERVRTRSFVLSTILLPAFMFGVTVLPSMIASRKSDTVRHIVIAASDQVVADEIGKQLRSSQNDGKYRPETRIVTDADRGSLNQAVSSGQIDGYVWVTTEAINSDKVTFAAASTSDFVEGGELRGAVNAGVRQARLQARGISASDAEALMKSVNVDSVKIEGGQQKAGGGFGQFFASFGLAFTLYMMLIMYGMSTMRSILEEKTSRVMEVLLSSVEAKDLMAGKIIGVGAVGLTQMAVWVIFLALLSTPQFAASSQLREALSLPPLTLVLLPVYFILGYMLYSSMYAALGAMVNSEQEAQQWQWIVTLPLIIPIVMITAVIRQPDSALSTWMSMVPFFSPILMYVRIAAHTPPTWQIVLSLVLLLATMYLLVVVCSRIYRVGILMYGKRPTLPEIMKWLKYA